MNRNEVQTWLDAYVAAWKAYDPSLIGALFSEDVEYRYHPWDEPVRGRDAVVKAWLGEGSEDVASAPDERGTYDGRYEPVAVDGEVAVAVGTSSYMDPPAVYDNCFVIRFDADGRCREFADWYMQRPATE
jgi:hypothetical protein